MDAFIRSIAWHYMVFAKTGNGDIWRIWFNGDQPLMERLIGNETEYREALTLVNADNC